MEIPILLDPTVLRAARRIYRIYCTLNSRVSKRPFGVAINRRQSSPQLIFNNKPILLPENVSSRLSKSNRKPINFCEDLP
jgi:hypothetical protein